MRVWFVQASAQRCFAIADPLLVVIVAEGWDPGMRLSKLFNSL
jgi:hypothetical protein